MIMNKDSLIMREMFQVMRENNAKYGMLTEEANAPRTIPINNSTFPGVFEAEKERFSQVVPSVSFGENAFLFNPTNNTVELNGTVSSMGGLKFKFSTDVSSPGSGCFIYVEGMVLNTTTVQMMATLYGYYQTFEKNWATSNVENILSVNKEQLNRMQQQV